MSQPSAPGRPAMPPSALQRVTVVDVAMPFGSMVTFMLKWALATIPAAIILVIFGFLASAVVGVIMTSLFSG